MFESQINIVIQGYIEVLSNLSPIPVFYQQYFSICRWLTSLQKEIIEILIFVDDTY